MTSVSHRIADVIAATLAAHGIRHAFGMPGGEVVTLLDALVTAGIKFTLCRHETAGAIMAAGAATVTGAPAVLLTTLGPGLANAVNGIADAAQEQVPLIVLSGTVDAGLRGRFTHQVLDHAALLQPLVKGSFTIGAEGAGATLARAIALAQRAPAGPVHVDLAPGLAAQPAAASDTVWSPPQVVRPHVSGGDQAISAFAARLAQAERPVVLAGMAAARAPGLGTALQALLALRAMPVLTTYKAKGVLAEDHPCALGGAGLSPLADARLLPLLRSADLVVLLGYDPIEMRAGWIEPFAANAWVVELTDCPPDHGMHRIDQRLLGGLTELLAALVAAMAPLQLLPSWRDGAPGRVRAAVSSAFEPPPSEALTPHAAFAALAAALPPSATVTVDSGAHRILFSQMWICRRPLALLQSAGFCTMGAALPLAIGAAIALHDADKTCPVVAVLGDGGLEMGLGELATLRDCQRRVIVFVLQDKSLALIALKQAQAGLPAAGVELGLTDFTGVARAYGGYGATVTTPEDLDIALREALAAPGFALISCRISADAYAGRI